MGDSKHKNLKNDEHMGRCVMLQLCNDKEKSPGPLVHSVYPALTKSTIIIVKVK